MNAAALDQFLARCSQELEERQSQMVKEFQFDRCDRFTVDLERGLLVAECQGEAIATAQAIPIATYDPNSHTWYWAWTQMNLPEALRQDAMELQGLADKTGLQLFKAVQFQADRDLVWELTAMACDQLQARGCYRLAQDNHYLMFALRNLEAIADWPEVA